MKSENNLYMGGSANNIYASFGESTLLTTERGNGDGQTKTGQQALRSQLVLCPWMGVESAGEDK